MAIRHSTQAGTGIAEIICPTVLQIGRQNGFRTVLRAWALGVAILAMPLYYLIRHRIPSSRAVRMRRFDFSFAKDPAFILYEISTLLQGLGFFLPIIYLPSFARSVAGNSTSSGNLTASLPLVLFNISSVVGYVLMDLLIDRFSPSTCMFISAFGPAIAVLAVCGTATSLAQVYVFCLLYGLFAGSFTTTWSGIVDPRMQRSRSAFPGMIFSLLAVGRGTGSVLSGPLSSVLVKSGQSWSGHLGIATAYGGIIVFVGVTALAGGGFGYPAMLARSLRTDSAR